MLPDQFLLTFLASEILLSNMKLTQLLNTSKRLAFVLRTFIFSSAELMCGPIGTILACIGRTCDNL